MVNKKTVILQQNRGDENMGIGSVRAMGDMAGTRQRAAYQPVDPVSKNIQNEISRVQRQKQGLSAKEDMSAGKKMRKRQELQQELAGLNTQLRQRQAQFHEKEQKEALRDEAGAVVNEKTNGEKAVAAATATESEKKGRSAEKEDVKRKPADIESTEKEDAKRKPADIESAEKRNISAKDRKNTEMKAADAKAVGIEDVNGRAAGTKGSQLQDIGLPQKDMRKIINGDSVGKQVRHRAAVIARMESGIAILKGEIRQDEARGADVEKKKVRLEMQEKKVQKAASGLPDLEMPSKPFEKAAGKKSERDRERTYGELIRKNQDGAVLMTANFSQGIIL